MTSFEMQLAKSSRCLSRLNVLKGIRTNSLEILNISLGITINCKKQYFPNGKNKNWRHFIIVLFQSIHILSFNLFQIAMLWACLYGTRFILSFETKSYKIENWHIGF